jgi:hypothetical protein
LLETVSGEELALWQGFDQLHPIGDWRHDLGYGIIASTVANANRGRNVKPFEPFDFMPLAPKRKESLGQKIRDQLLKASGSKKRVVAR